MILGALTAYHHTGIVRGRRHHTEHFARRGFDGDNTANLAFHQTLAQGLKVCIDSQRQVLTWLRTLIELAVAITSLHTTMGIAQENLYTLHTTQLFLV